MDQDKIGKLIAKLRKEKGLTQRELGDKVGVGFKAVSKWERGITCPDISIINELSKILGITSDELLTGELSKERNISNKPSKKVNKKLLLIVAIVAFVGLVAFVFYKIESGKIDVYKLVSDGDEYQVEGKIMFKNDNMGIYISNLNFNNKEFNNTIIKNYDYKIYSNDNILISYGHTENIAMLASKITVFDFLKSFAINYEGQLNISKDYIIKNGIILKFSFLDENDELITKDIQINLKKLRTI